MIRTFILYISEHILNINVSEDVKPFIDFTLGLFILSLLLLLIFTRIVANIFSVYLIEKYDLYSRYPKFSKLFKLFEKIRSYHALIDIFFAYIIILSNIILCSIVLAALL